MIKVAIIGGLLHSGGKKNLIMEFYRNIDKSKVQMDLIADSDSNGIPTEEWESLGGKVFVITPYKNLIAHECALYKIFKENNYDVVHGFDNTLNVFAMFVAKLAGIKLRINESISMGHKGELKNYIKLILKPFSKLFANRYMANGVDCGIWQFGKKAYEKGDVTIFKTVINVEANAFDKQLRDDTRARHGWNGNVVYGFIGRFEMQKNPLFLIDIFNEISKKQDNAKLVIIGHGSMKDQMEERIKNYGIADKVENLGKTENIKQYYNAFDAFILPSLYEGLPVVAPESQACGLPMFMSTEITREAAGCELATFIDLNTPAEKWADIIIEKTVSNMPIRRSYVNEIIAAGFDSKAEAERLQNYYIQELGKV